MKNIKFVILLLLISNLVSAQNIEDTAKKSTDITKPFMIKAGYLQTDLYGDDLDALSVDGETKALNSFMIGFEFHSEINSFLSLKHELNFQIHGAEIQLLDDNNVSYDSSLKMNAFELQPLNLTFRYKGFQIYVGPYASALVSATIERKDENGNIYKDKSIFGKPDEEAEENKYLQKIDFGATAGLLYEFNKTINIGVRYSHGLMPVFDNSLDQNKIKIYNKSFGVFVGYSF